MTNTSIRVGLIGCGMITQRSHAPGFNKVESKDGATEELGESDLMTDARDSFHCFADAIRGVAPTPAPREVGHAVQRVLDAILLSGEQEGAPVAVE